MSKYNPSGGESPRVVRYVVGNEICGRPRNPKASLNGVVLL